MASSFELPAIPFVVDPVNPASVQLWGQRAVQFSSCDGLYVMSDVFSGLFYDAACADWFASVVGVWSSDVSATVRRLDALLGSVRYACGLWSSVAGRLQRIGVTVSDSCYHDAVRHVQVYTLLVSQVADYVALCCSYAGFALPKRTADYFASLESSQVVEAV